MKLSKENKTNIGNSIKLLHKDWRQVLTIADQQGWVFSKSKKGIRMASPNGENLIFIHLTPTSDHRALANKKSELRRAGLNV